MKNLSKSLLAVALLAAGTGAANASINAATAATGTTAEAFMQVYDHTNGLTYDLDLGVTVATLIANAAAGTNFSLTLSDANWTTFTGGSFAANDTKFAVVGGNGAKVVFSSDAVSAPLAASAPLLTTAGNNIALQAGRINVGATVNTALNVSKLVLDTATSGTGQWATANGSTNVPTNLFGGLGNASAAIAYGLSGNLYYENVVSAVVGGANIGTVSLIGNTFTISQVSQVPLPAAVWMFGAGLMGVLRLNRRKSAAI